MQRNAFQTYADATLVCQAGACKTHLIVFPVCSNTCMARCVISAFDLGCARQTCHDTLTPLGYRVAKRFVHVEF